MSHLEYVSVLVSVKRFVMFAKPQKFLARRCETYNAKEDPTMLKRDPHEELRCDYNSVVI